MKKFLTTRTFFSTALPLILFFGFVGVVSGSFTEPGSNPPSGNIPAPINASGADQTKSGNLWVDNVIADSLKALSELCIGTECRTAWSVPGQDFSTTCTVNRKIVANPSSPGIPHASRGSTDLWQLAQECRWRISSAERDAGWMLVGFDNCPSVASRDCAGASYCQYIQLSCESGITTSRGRHR